MQGRLEAKDPAFHAIIDRRAEVTTVATGFAHADGPVFGRLGYLLFTDPPRDRILRYAIPPWKIGPAEGSLSVHQQGCGRARGLTLDHQGRLLACESGPGRVVRVQPGSETFVLASHYRGKRLSSPADVVCAIDGSIYFTDVPRRGETSRAGRTGLARIYQITRSGELRVAPAETERPAGICLGPRQLEVYVTDGSQMNIRIFKLAPDGGLVSSRIFAALRSSHPGRLGGLKTDEDGNVYVAGPGGVWVFDPRGQHLGTVLLPEQPTNLCWGRASLGLYITARKSLYHVATRVTGTRTF